MADIGTVLGHATPRETAVRVCVAGDKAAELEAAIEESRKLPKAKAEKLLADARAAVDEATYTFKFRAITATERAELIASIRRRTRMRRGTRKRCRRRLLPGPVWTRRCRTLRPRS